MVFSSSVEGDCYLKNLSCYLTRRGIDVVLVPVGDTNGKKQVLEVVSEAKVVISGKPLSMSPFIFYSNMQAVDLEQLIFQKVDRPECFNSRKTWFWPLGV